MFTVGYAVVSVAEGVCFDVELVGFEDVEGTIEGDVGRETD